MSIVSQCIARLQALQAPAFAIVEGAVELSAVKGRPNAMPAAYVFVKEEAARPNERMTGPVLQRLEQDIAVVLITENLSDTHGAALGEDLESLKANVNGALLGLVPTNSDDGSPLEYVSGAVLRMQGGVVWHESIFSASTYIGELVAEGGDDDGTF